MGEELIDRDDVIGSPHRQEYESFLQLDRFREGSPFDPTAGLYARVRKLQFSKSYSTTIPTRNLQLYPKAEDANPSESLDRLFDKYLRDRRTFIAAENVSFEPLDIEIRAGDDIGPDVLEPIRDRNRRCIEDQTLNPLERIAVLAPRNPEEMERIQHRIEILRADGKSFQPSHYRQRARVAMNCTGYSLRFPWGSCNGADFEKHLLDYECRCRWEAGRLRVAVYGTFQIRRETSWTYENETFETSVDQVERELLVGRFPLFSSRSTLLLDGVERVPILQLVPASKRSRSPGSKAKVYGLDELRVKTFLDHVRGIVEREFEQALGRLPYRVRNVASLDQLELTTEAVLEQELGDLVRGECTRVLNDLNPLAEVSQKRGITLRGPGGVVGDHAPWGQRGVHWTHVGRICLTETPESKDIGLNLFMALAARVRDGTLEAPYRDLHEGGKPRWLAPAEDAQQILAPRGFSESLEDGKTLARKNGSEFVAGVDTAQITLEEKYCGQFLGIGANLIPFLQHDDNNRVMMGAKNAKQAIPLMHPEEPLVQTGREELAARLSGHPLYARKAGIVQQVDRERIVVRGEDDVKEEYRLETERPTLQGALVRHRPIVRTGDRVEAGQVLADGSATCNGKLALGVNLLVAYLSWEGFNFEDGIVASDRLVREDVLTSRHMICEDMEVLDGESMSGPDGWQRDAAVIWNPDLCDLYAHGGIFCAEGDRVRKGDKLFGKVIHDAGKPVVRYTRAPVSGKVIRILHRSIEPTASLRESAAPPDGTQSRRPKVCFVKACWIQYDRKLEVGDKLMGRHGNKGVVAAILPEQEMPRLPDGTAVDLILNPHGVVSRMNLGQLLETHWGWVLKKGDSKKVGSYAIVPHFKTVPEEDLERALGELSHTGVDTEGKFELHRLKNGTKEHFPNRIVAGYQYFMKLNHLAEDKLQARETGLHSLVVRQPVKGKRVGGGQKFGEMEVWALESHAAFHFLRELLTVRSDAAWDRMEDLTARYWRQPGPACAAVLFTESVYATVILLRGLALDLVWIDAEGREVPLLDWKYGRNAAPIVHCRLRYADARTLETWARGRIVTKAGFPLWDKTQWTYPEGGLFDPKFFNTIDDDGKEPLRENMAFIQLVEPVVHPLRIDEAVRRIIEALPKVQEDTRPLFPFRCATLLAARDVGWKACRGLERCLRRTLFLESLVDAEGTLIPADFLYFSCRCGILRGRKAAGVRCPSCGKPVARGPSAPEPWKKPLRGGGDFLKYMGEILHFDAQDMLLDRIPVLPLDFRPIQARFGNGLYRSPLNDHYKSLLAINGKIDSLRSRGASAQTVCIGLKRSLQRAVIRLMTGKGGQESKGESLADRIAGKEGILRMHLLGKRVNISARSVIVPDPTLLPDQVAVPRSILRKLLHSRCVEECVRALATRPDVEHEDEARKILADGGVTPWMWERIIGPKLDPHMENSLLNGVCAVLQRSPSLHKYNVLAYRPVPTKNRKVIGLHPLSCRFFNADFDGDTMALFLPLFAEAHDEAESRLLATRNLLSLANGKALYHFDQDIALGMYLFTATPEGRKTFDKWFEEAQQALADKDKQAVRFPPLDAPIPRKGLEERVLRFHRTLKDPEKTAALAQRIMRVGFEEATRWGITLGLFDIPTREQIEHAVLPKMTSTPGIEDDHHRQTLGRAQMLAEVFEARAKEPNSGRSPEDALKQWLEENSSPCKDGRTNPLALLVRSGARGNMKQIRQLGFSRGTMQDMDGVNIDPPVKGNFRKGVSPLEYVIGSQASRRTMCEKKLSVADAGAFTRDMVEAAYPLVVREHDCNTENGVTFFPFPLSLPVSPRPDDAVKLPPLTLRLYGRVSADSGDIVSEDLAETLQAQGGSIRIRSILTCKASERYGYGAVCARCYGWDLSRMDYPEIGALVGIWAAQSIGERGTQLSMRTFHTGGGGGESAIMGGLAFMKKLLGCGAVGPLMYRMSQNVKEEKEATIWEAFHAALHTNAFPSLAPCEETPQRITKNLKQAFVRWGLDTVRTILAFEGYRIYEGAVDERHFEVILKALLMPDAQKPTGLSRVPFSHLSDHGFLAQAAYQRALQELAQAASEGREDRLELLKARLMLGNPSLPTGA